MAAVLAFYICVALSIFVRIMWALILLFGIVLAQLAVASDSLEWSEFLPNAITRERPTLLSYFSDNLQIPAQIRLYRADKFFSFPETLTG